MEVPKATRYDCLFFMLSQHLFYQIPTAQDRQEYRKRSVATKAEGHSYLVKQVDKIIGDAFGATLVCAGEALCSDIRICIPGISCIEWNGKHIGEQEKAWEASTVLSSWLSKAQKIEVVIGYLRDKYHRYFASMYVSSQLLGDMLLKRTLGKKAYEGKGKGKAPSWFK